MREKESERKRVYMRHIEKGIVKNEKNEKKANKKKSFQNETKLNCEGVKDELRRGKTRS